MLIYLRLMRIACCAIDKLQTDAYGVLDACYIIYPRGALTRQCDAESMHDQYSLVLIKAGKIKGTHYFGM